MNRQQLHSPQETNRLSTIRKTLEKLLEVTCKEMAPAEILVLSDEEAHHALADQLVAKIASRNWSADIYDNVQALFSPNEAISADSLKEKWQEFAIQLKASFERNVTWLDENVSIIYSLLKFKVQENPHQIELETIAMLAPKNRNIPVSVNAILNFTISLKENQQ